MTETWKPTYSRWRHGGWYVHNVRYPNGAIGCVSNNYTDKKWRIVCGPHECTFPSRDAAARAERVLALTAATAQAPILIQPEWTVEEILAREG